MKPAKRRTPGSKRTSARPAKDTARGTRPNKDGPRSARPAKDGPRGGRPAKIGARGSRPASDQIRPRRPRQDGMRSVRSGQEPTRSPRALQDNSGSDRLSNSERLQKILAAAGIASRRKCEEYIVLGRVTVDGQTVRELGVKVNPHTQEIAFDGEPIRPERKSYYWLNKPTGVLCTARDPGGRHTVLDLLPDVRERLFPVGRLDENSTGLLLLTNDGWLAQRLTHPSYGVPKTYDVLVAGRISNEELAKLRKGIWLAEGRVRATSIRRLKGQGQAARLLVVLSEGRNREIRRMFAQLGHKVMKLERIAIGTLKLRRLKPGQYRLATSEEVDLLRELASSRQAHAPIGSVDRQEQMFDD